MKNQIHFMFLHGIGVKGPLVYGGTHPTTGARILRANVEGLGLRPEGWGEIDWHAAVQQPLEITSGGASVKQVRQLTRGFIGAAMLMPRDASQLQRGLVGGLFLLTAFAPIWIFFWPGAGVAALGVAAALAGVLAREFGRRGLAAAVRHFGLFLMWLLWGVATIPLHSAMVGVAVIGAVAAGFSWVMLYEPTGVLGPAISNPWTRFRGEVAGVAVMFILIAALRVMMLFAGLLHRFASWTTLNRLFGVVKRMSDVAAFMGNHEYREKLLRHVGDEAGLVATGVGPVGAATVVSTSDVGVTRIAPGDVVVVCGHSLGSALAVEFLACDEAAIPPSASVLLVTMGSPLKRYLSTFFPHCWPTPKEIYDKLARRYQRFTWVNVYHPRDPVGARLFGAEADPKRRCRDVSTGQWSRWWGKAHEYWDVEEVPGTVFPVAASLLVEADPSEDGPKSRPPAASLLTAYDQAELPRTLGRFQVVIPLVLALAVYAAVLEGIWWSPTRMEIRQAAVADVLAKAVPCEEVPGTLSYWTEAAGKYATPVPRANLAFRPRGRQDGLAFGLIASEVDIRGLGAAPEPKDKAVTVRYAADDPERFVVLNHTRGPGYVKSLATFLRVAKSILLAFICLGGVGITTYFGAASLYSLGASDADAWFED